MRVPRAGHAFFLLLAASLVAGQAQPGLTAQARGGGGFSTSRVASTTVLASWTSQWNNADGTTITLLVLWRGTPGWFTKGARGGSGGGGGTGGTDGTYRAQQTIAAGGRTFALDFELGKDTKLVRMLGQDISLQAVNVILVDDANSASGPRIVGSQWVEPAREGQSGDGDVIAGIVKRTPALFEYLQCDLVLDDPLMKGMTPIMCDPMRP